MNEKEEALRQALLSLVPAGTLHLLELLKVAEIRLTRDCKTVTVARILYAKADISKRLAEAERQLP